MGKKIPKQKANQPSAPLERTTLATQVRDYLLIEITHGRLSPGDPVRELDIASRLGTSQTPVREAFRDLAALGVLESRNHVGTRVREVSESELVSAVPVRAALEGLAARLAAPVIHENPEPLQLAFEEMLEVAKGSDRLLFARASTKFHRTFVYAAQNESLIRAWNALGIEVMTIITVLKNLEPLAEAAEGHRAIFEALTANAPDLAESYVHEHVAAYIPGQEIQTSDLEDNPADSSNATV